MRIHAEPTPSRSPRDQAGLLGGIALGTFAITLLFLGMRAVMAIGGACADGGPYVPARPCPDGVPLAMLGGMLGIFAGGGVVALYGSRLGGGLAGVALLGWPILFLSLGWNFLEFGLSPPGDEGVAWGWIISAIAFAGMGGGPLVVGLLLLPGGTYKRLVGRLPALIVLAALAGVGLASQAFNAISS